jgi:hypothetical protein
MIFLRWGSWKDPIRRQKSAVSLRTFSSLCKVHKRAENTIDIAMVGFLTYRPAFLLWKLVPSRIWTVLPSLMSFATLPEVVEYIAQERSTRIEFLRRPEVPPAPYLLIEVSAVSIHLHLPSKVKMGAFQVRPCLNLRSPCPRSNPWPNLWIFIHHIQHALLLPNLLPRYSANYRHIQKHSGEKSSETDTTANSTCPRPYTHVFSTYAHSNVRISA